MRVCECDVQKSSKVAGSCEEISRQAEEKELHTVTATACDPFKGSLPLGKDFR